MTYLEAAMDIIEMYNNLAVASVNMNKACGDHSEAVAIAVEALSIVASMKPSGSELDEEITDKKKEENTNEV